MTRLQWFIVGAAWLVVYFFVAGFIGDRMFIIHWGGFLFTCPVNLILGVAWVSITFNIWERERYQAREARRHAERERRWAELHARWERGRQEMRGGGPMTHPDCPFCAIVRGEAPAKVVDEFERVIVIEPINPVVPGHVLVIPKEHVADFAERNDVTGATMSVAAYFAGSRDGYADCNLITSKGSAATQTVFHLHVHLVPRTDGDGLALPWTEQQRTTT